MVRASRPVRRAAAVAVAMVLGGAVACQAQPDAQPAPPRAVSTPSAAADQVTPTPSASPSCDTVAHAFVPRTIVIPGVTTAASVVTPPREQDGSPGVPPLTDRGKTLFAWDRSQGIRPGDPAGNVLLNAHTWPDGSALGNRLLAHLQRGDRIVVRGLGVRLCYRVTERVEVPADRSMPRYYATDGPPQLAIIVCSGRRLAPGVWEKRTVWFASPSV